MCASIVDRSSSRAKPAGREGQSTSIAARVRLVDMLRLLALIVPLSLDTFAVSAAIGVSGLSARERLRVSLLFALFEGIMPLVGFLVGAAVGEVIGQDADYIAGGLLVALGGYMLLAEDEAQELKTAQMFARTRGLAVIGLGVGISVDELVIGFSVGLLRISIVLAAVLIATQAFVAAQIGIRLGQRLGEEFREGAEKLAGAMLVVLGFVFLGQGVLGD
jgi:putative Mn2+ efflux pump MntP